MELNITNGLYFNEYIKQKIDGIFIPFNEAFIEGKLLFPLFDKSFIKERIKEHQVTEEEYLMKLKFFFEPLNIKQYDEIKLWFGLDTFCQINMLVLLSYLEQIEYKGKVYYQAIDDATCNNLETEGEIFLGEFLYTYKSLIEGKLLFTKYDFINNGLKDYVYLKNKDNHFYQYIKENLGKLTETQLIGNILNVSSNFGLSDIYVKKMINEVATERIK